ncbi:MAG: glycosyl hydrolase, partial [Candidatus Eremiobacteraeota bacterium]|nr:glycosyl hydrolase [Candidatus Eremiobacteraeota bacterium]
MLLSTVLLAAAAYANLSWRPIGPAVSGGRVTSVAGTPQNDQLYYIGSAGGGVWKSANGGATWEPVFEKESVSAVGAVAIDPTNDQIVWAGTGESNPRNDVSYGDGVYKSSDGGKTWRRVGLAGVWSVSRIAIDPKNPRHVVVGAFGDPFKDSADRGVYVTFDGGASWRKSLYLSPASGASDVALNPRDPRIVYAGMWHFRRIPWTFTSGGPDDGLYKSSDGGRTWRRLTGSGLPSGLTGRIGLAIAPSRPDRVFALIEAKGGILWRTDDDGRHWTMTSNDTLVDQRPFYFTHIAVDPHDAGHVYAVSEMLAESTDGGRKFKEIAKGVHVDYHAIWIDPANSKRIMVGEDGGYALTTDLKHWSFSRNVPIGQIYHVGLSDENPYTVCAAFQDNGGFCGPANSLDSEGILDRHWIDVVGGDGMWTVPDPGNPRYVWADLEDGALTLFDRTTQVSRFIRPYDAFPGSFLGPFDLSAVPYRFNWDSPVAFDPWSSRVAWFGGNVIFQSGDRGETWTPISSDLTRDIKAHQVPSGGPLAKDVSGAEYSDTILDIEGSPLRRGEIWAGTDDGYVQVTTDASTGTEQLAHWRNVTPPQTPEYARIETVAPSPLIAGTTYVVADNHRMGDYAPYIFVTHDGGATWTKIVNGLPANQYARTVRPDTRNPYLLYAGTENGLWISFDGGAHWENFRINLPTVSVRDIRV